MNEIVKNWTVSVMGDTCRSGLVVRERLRDEVG
jgi:hypothetical protein